MLAKIFNAAAALALATMLAVGGFVGYLTATGRLNATRLERIAAVLRGELDQWPSAAPAPAEPAPDDSAATRPAGPVHAARERDHLARLQSERAARDLEAQRRLLEQVLQRVIQEQEALAAQRKLSQVETKQQQEASAAADAGFKKELELVSGLQPKQAKEHIVRVYKKQPADAARLLQEMDAGRVKRVLEQFKSPEELQIQSDLLEQVRLQASQGLAESSGKTAGSAIQ